MIKAVQPRLQVLSGNAHPELAGQIAKQLKLKLTPVTINRFANGEINCKLTESVRGDDIFIVQSHTGDLHTAIMEQLIMIDACKRASARSITAVCPFLGYARQDRKASGREPISARLLVDMFSAAGADRIMTVDLHAGQIQGFFDGPFDHLIAMPILKTYIEKHFASDNLVIVSPDAGRVKSTERYASALNCGIAIIHKQRSYTKKNSVEAKYLIGDVKGKTCIITDDMIDTAGTICAAADLLAENGAKEIYGVSTHGILSDPALERIEKSAFKKVIVTNTLPLQQECADSKKCKVVQLSIAPLLADAIAAVYSGASVSAIFGGHNQM